MTDAKAWGKKLQEFRFRAGCSSQGKLVERLSEPNIAVNIPSYEIGCYENGNRLPKDRSRHLDLVEGLVRLSGIQTPEEADGWLALAGQSYLTPEERQLIFRDATNPEPTINHSTIRQLSPVPHVRQVVKGLGNVTFGIINGGQVTVNTQPTQTHNTSSIQMIVTEADLAELRAALSYLKSRIEI